MKLLYLLLLCSCHLQLHLVLLHGQLLLLLQEGLVAHLVALTVVRLRLSVHHHLLIVVILFFSLLDSAKLLLTHLEVDSLDLLDLSVDPGDFERVSMDLGLVVLELRHHLLELLSALFEVLLVLGQLLGHVGAALLRQDVLQLNVELLLLLDEHVFF